MNDNKSDNIVIVGAPETESYTSYRDNNNSKKGIIIACAVVASILLIGVVAFVIFKSGLFLSPHKKLLLATYNTVSEDTIGHALIQANDVMNAPQLTIETKTTVSDFYDNISYDGTIATDIDNGVVGATGNLSINGVNERFGMYYDPIKLQISVPDLVDGIFEYNYNKTNAGILSSLVKDYTKGDIEDINNILKCISSYMKGSSGYEKLLKDNIQSAYNNLAIEKLDSKKLTIDGKLRKCKGYQVNITTGDVKSFLDAVDSSKIAVYGTNIDSFSRSLANLGVDDVDKIFDTYSNLSDIMSTESSHLCTIDVYIYKNKLAEVSCPDWNNIVIDFTGGDNRASNMIASFTSGDSILTIERKSSLSGNVEEGILSINGSEYDYSYNPSTGKYYSDEISGTFLVDKNSIYYDFDNYNLLSFSTKTVVSKGCNITPLLGGNVIDAGSLTETDLMGLIFSLTF